MCAYASTPNKEAVRGLWDRPALEAHFRDHGPLSYLGLPGPDICDFVDWGGLLARARTGVEAPGRTRRQKADADAKISRLLMNVSVRGLGDGFELLIGDIEDVLIDGFDAKGRSPQLEKYDFVNLDFDGGFGFYASGEVRRPQALRALFRRQRGCRFTLFLTVNVRDTLGSEIDSYLGSLLGRASSTDEADLIRWRLNRPDGERVLRLQPVISDFVRVAAEGEGFSCKVLPLVTYEGHERARMLHFVFQLDPASSLRGFSKQSTRDVLELPMLEAVGGNLSIAWRAPDSDIGSALAFLDARVLESLGDGQR